MAKAKPDKKGNSLEGIVDSVRDLHSPQLDPHRRNTTIRGQIVFPGVDICPTGSSRAVAMGRFYEYVTAALYGGRLGDVVDIGNRSDTETTNGNGVGDLETDSIAKPDVVHSGKNIIYESKACRSGQTCKLADEQIDAYRALQARDPPPRVYYVVYRHNVRGIKSSWRGTTERLFKELSEGTAYSLVLPFRLILRLYNPENLSRYVSRYQGRQETRNDFDTCTCIRSSALTKILKEPKTVVEDLGLDCSSFELRRILSPRKFYVNRHRVNQFPILFIEDRDERWREEFPRGYSTEQGVPF